MTRFRSCRRTSLLTRLLLYAALLPGANAGAQSPTANAAGVGQIVAASPKFLSWNVAGGRCGDKRPDSEFTPVVTQLQHLQVVHDFDVLNLQEIYLDQAYRVARALNAYGVRRAVFFARTVRCDDGEIRGNAIISKYRLGGRRIYMLPNSPRDTGNGEYRKLMGASIRVGGRLIRVFNLHLTADGYSHLRNSYREKQVRFIRSYLNDDRDEASGPWRAVVAGDFNTQSKARPYRIMTHRMKDAWAVHTGRLDGSDGCTHFPSEGECTRVDYIFYEGAIGLGSAGVLDTERMSDHRPIVAHFTLD